MKKIFLLAALAVSVISTSCTKDPIFGDDKGCKGGDPKPGSCEAVIVDEGPLNDSTSESAGTNISKAWIEGNDLKLAVGYSGCGKHTYDMHWNKNQVNIAIYPNQTYLQLVDNNGDEFCQAYFQDTLCFDISKIKPGVHGEVVVKVQGHTNVSVPYKY